MTKFRDGLLGPTVILLIICAVITLLLAVVYQMTLPVIAQVEIDAANSVRAKVIDAASFSEVQGIDLPEGVSEVYRAGNGTGYVVRSVAKGYGGSVTFMIGIDNDGIITGIEMFDHTETPGLGTKIGKPAYLAQYEGKDNPEAVDGISGATKTSNALKNSIAQALEAYKIAKEAA